MSGLEVAYRLQTAGRGRSSVAATQVYRGLLAKSMYSQCEMVPTDSQVFTIRARECGALRAAVLGIARLILERAATQQFLQSTRRDGRFRWVDIPDKYDPCGLGW